MHSYHVADTFYVAYIVPRMVTYGFTSHYNDMIPHARKQYLHFNVPLASILMGS